MARSGARWRDLPEHLGGYETVKRRYYRWIEMGVLDEILAPRGREAAPEWLMIDRPIVRAARPGASAGARPPPGKRGADAHGLGRSHLPLSTKTSTAGDALHNPVRLI